MACWSRVMLLSTATGKNVIFINDNGLARMVLLSKITGHTRNPAGIIGDEALMTSQMVIIKGNKRIRDGQAVRTE